MTVRLLMEGDNGDIIPLDSVVREGRGVEALAGAVGLGLPSVTLQYDLGAGDGAVFRGRRVPPRDVDLPLYVQATDREDLKAWVKRLGLLLAGRVRLTFDEGSDETWYLDCHRVGGGEWVYGVDTVGETDVQTVVTLRAGDPYWTRSQPTLHVVSNEQDGRGLIYGTGTSLSDLKLMDSQEIGEMTFVNEGNAEAFPLWIVDGPAESFHAVSPATGEEFEWIGELEAGEILYVDTKGGRVYDDTGANRYDGMAPAPRLWTIPPGTSTGVVALSGSDGDSRVTCQYQPRMWAVI